ncbi:Uncharacterised protein [Citrobacter koseri]|nr:Uncharacterised protein [Citrobacter koseri]
MKRLPDGRIGGALPANYKPYFSMQWRQVEHIICTT